MGFRKDGARFQSLLVVLEKGRAAYGMIQYHTILVYEIRFEKNTQRHGAAIATARPLAGSAAVGLAAVAVPAVG